MNSFALAIALSLTAPLQTAGPTVRDVPVEVAERTIRLPVVGDATVYVPADPTDRAILFLSSDGG